MNVEKNKISVVIPMYNSEKTIINCLDSVIKQVCENIEFEVIVVNDGSKDGSLDKVNQYVIDKKDIGSVEFKVFNQKNKGVSYARNIGMKHSTGEWIAFLDSDDVWLENKIKLQVEEINKNPTIDLIGTARKGDGFKKFGYMTKISSRVLLYKNFFSTPTVMIKRDILKSIGFFDENQKYAEEGDYWIRICQKGTCFLLNKELVYTGNGKPNYGFSGLSSNLWAMEKGELKNLNTARKLKIIGSVEYLFVSFFSLIKYFRRVVIVKFR